MVVKDRIVYLNKDAKVLTPEQEREKLYKQVCALLEAAPKGMKIADIAAKTRHSPQKLIAALRPHIEAKEVKKVGDAYVLTAKPALEPAKKKPE